MSRACAFCAIASGEGEAQIVHQGGSALAFLDRAPLFHGHVLVAPRAHVPTLDDVPDDLVAPVFALVRRVSRAQQRALGADGTYVAVNTRVSQSVPHLHVHVVPRRQGDGLFRAGMVWVRRRYAAGQDAEIAARLRAALDDGS